MQRPVTILLVLCVVGVMVSVLAAVVCQNNEKCKESFDVPIAALICVGLLVVCTALVYVEVGMGRSTGALNGRY